MAEARSPGRDETYFCPMHPEVRRQTAGKCPTCGMNLVPEGTRFGMLRRMMSKPPHLAAMAAIIAAAMMM